ncbi:MAG: putative metal-binding motif-containing protein, partial [Nanoarchaeota archaeon]|nr:putative metal-binding motif-containing protein [Nanoarchaeota archaeon]
AEICNGIDDDCDGQIDENNGNCGQGQICTNGQCKNIKCYSNSDCGVNGFVGEGVCQNNDVFKNFKTYTCINPGQSNSQCTDSLLLQLFADCSESYCELYGNDFCRGSDVYSLKKCYNKGCSNGNCYNNPYDQEVFVKHCNLGCSNGLCTQSSCIDNDHDNYDTCSPGQPGDDGKPVDCNDNNPNIHPNAAEICNGIDDDCDGQIDENNGNCGQGQICSNGQCKNIKCYSNSDCNDYNLYTLDKCNNPGQITSYCTNTPINCITEQDCGLDGFTGDLFCQTGDVFQNFIDYTCNNPGTIQSSCSIISSPKLKTDCINGQICFNGGCITGCADNDHDNYDTCNPGQPGDDGKPNDCNDNNPNIHPNAAEICNGIDDDCDGQIDENNGNCANNQKCVNGQCRNIICFFDSDCGADGYIGDKFCSGNDVKRKYKDFTCNNPGSVDSSCSDSTIDKLIETCAENKICKNAVCVNKEICNDGIDNDGDGLIDGLIELNPNNGETKSWLKDPLGIRDFVNNKASLFGYSSYPDSALRLDSITANKFCNIEGYSVAISYDCVSNFDNGRCGWHSCQDNGITFWNSAKNNWDNLNACTAGNRWLSSVTCKNKLAQCSDGIDNDGDGKIDMNDPGCANPNDNSEIQHDPDCA